MITFIVPIILSVAAHAHGHSGATITEFAYERFGNDWMRTDSTPIMHEGRQISVETTAGSIISLIEGSWKSVTVISGGDRGHTRLETKLLHDGKVVQYHVGTRPFRDALPKHDADGSVEFASGLSVKLTPTRGAKPERRVIDGVACQARTTTATTGDTKVIYVS